MPFNMRPFIKESNEIEDIYDLREVEQSLEAWRYLRSSPSLTHERIREVQRIITLNQPMDQLRLNQRGVYRDVSKTNVRVGNYFPPSWQDVQELMDDWLAGHGSRDAWWNHVYFEGIHPFADGNGRVGRMLMWHQQVVDGAPLWMIKARDRWDYYRSLDRDRRVQVVEMLGE